MKLHKTELLHLAQKIKENVGIYPAQDRLCSQMEDVGREELACVSFSELQLTMLPNIWPLLAAR